MTRLQVLYFVGSLVLCVVFSGCEGIPQLPVTAEEKSAPENVVTNFGRGSYDWFYADRKFEVIAPSELPVFEKLDQAAVLASFPSGPFVEPSAPYRPDGMEDDVYEIFRRLSEPYFDTSPFLEIPFSPAGNGMFAVSADGSRLALLAQHLEVWDLSESRIIGKHPLPSDSCSRVSWCSDTDDLMVMDGKALYSISVSTGETLQSWKPPVADTLKFFACAANSPVIVLSTAKGRMYLID